MEFASRALDKNQNYALNVLEHILTIRIIDRPECLVYSEVVKELYANAVHEMRRLAMRHADYFATFYDVLEQKIHEMSSQQNLDEKTQAELPCVLLIVMQRATNISPQIRRQRLQAFLEPIIRAWEDPQLHQTLSTFESFVSVLGLDQVGPFLMSQDAHKIEDWSKVPLNDDGANLQSNMIARFARLPLRNARSALHASTEKLGSDSQPYQLACELWSSTIPVIVTPLLLIIRATHRLHDFGSWPGLPPEMRSIVSRILQDRFWQAGISSGSRDDFYNRITSTKTTLEGFASFVRGKIRNTRENSYSILYSMSKLGEHFYGHKQLASPLSEALLGSAGFLSPHHFSVLLNIARCLIEECPANCRAHFLPPIMSTFFQQIDQKCGTEWAKLDRRKESSTPADDDLTQEMKEESILRQLTHTAVTMVATLLDPRTSNRHPAEADTTSLRAFILSSTTILEPLLLFCTHAILFHDTRTSGTMIRILRTLVPSFLSQDPAVEPTNAVIREFIADHVLRAAITALNDNYFVEQQKDLAALIATIWVAYGLSNTTFRKTTGYEGTHAEETPPLTQTPRNLLLSLPGMEQQRVDAVGRQLMLTGGIGGHHRQQRALVLGLLEGVRGVRVSELGNWDRKEEKKALAEKYARRDEMGTQGVDEYGNDIDRGDESVLAGVDGLFGDGA